MHKASMIALVVVLVLSLAGVGFLTFQVSNQSAAISRLNQDLLQANGNLSEAEKQLTKTGNDLTKTEGQLSQVKAKLADSQTELDKRQKSIDVLIEDNQEIGRELAQLRFMKCRMIIPKKDIESISTNQGLIDVITKTVEDDLGFVSVNTSFDVIWNNSKSAIFTILDPDRKTVKVVVSWDFDTSRIKGIYNVNRACIYYPN